MASTVLFLLAAVLFLGSSAANAQPPPPLVDGTIVNGQLTCNNGTGSPVAGTGLNVVCNGVVVGMGITTANGSFSIPVFGPRNISTCFVNTTLPQVGCIGQSAVGFLTGQVIPTASTLTVRIINGLLTFAVAVVRTFAVVRVT